KLRHKTQLIKLSISGLYVDLTLNPPGIAGPKQPLELAGLPFLRLSDLSGHQLVIDPALHVPEDAYPRRAARFARQPAQRERAAARRTSVRCARSVWIARATTDASAPIASDSGLNG